MKNSLVFSLSLLLLGLIFPRESVSIGSSLRCSSKSSSLLGGEASYDFSKLRKGPSVPPKNFKVAFFGDQGLGPNSEAVLQMIKDKNVEIVLHSGDYDYNNDPAGWEEQINKVLGEDYPYFGSIGNHDSIMWGVRGGYQERIINRLVAINATDYCTGEAGVKMACNYKGFLFVLSGVGSRQVDHPEFFDEVFSGSSNIWRAVTWHKNQRLFQCGGKVNEVGYEVYDTGRKHGAIVATSHEHSYCRTHLMDSFSNQQIASTDPVISLSPGKTFAFVSGLGGRSIREYRFGLENNPWWAATAAKDDDVTYAPLICTFNLDGEERKAECELQDLSGKVWDKFQIYSNITDISSAEKICSPKFVELSVESSDQDVSEDTNLDFAETDFQEEILTLGGSHLVGFQFLYSGLRRGEKLSEVHLQVFGAKEGMKDQPITIRGLFGFPSQGELLSSYQATKSFVLWEEEDEDWEKGTVWVSPDLTDLVEEIMEQDGWKDGDPISLVVSGPGEKFVYSSDYDDCLAPALTIEYQNHC